MVGRQVAKRRRRTENSKYLYHNQGPPDYMHNYGLLQLEFSRDIEPMKYGFGDNYYYQMVSYIGSSRSKTTTHRNKTKTITINTIFPSG